MVYTLLVVLAYGVLIVVVIFNFFSSKYLFGSKVPQEVPPGSLGWPLLGETPAFIQPHSSNSLGKFLEERCSRYGKVFKSHLLGAPTIVSCDPELNTFILQNEGRLFSNNLPKNVQEILGEQSIVVVSGQAHKRLRNVVISFINAFKISPDFLSYIENSVITMMENWKTQGQKEVAFLKEAKQLVFQLILKRVLDIDSGDAKSATIQEDLFTTIKGVRSLPIYILGTSYYKAMKAGRRLNSVLTTIISAIKVECSPTSENAEFVKEKLMKNELNDEEKTGVVRILLGGYEAASELLAVVVYFLARSPSALQELQEEHKALRESKKKGDPLSLEDYKKMDFTLKVINESLRCGNVSKAVPRKALQDVKYKGILIPSGWQVFPIFTATHMDTSLHENPSEFNPWRWNNEDTSRKVMPFGVGPRLCPGAEFVKLVTAFFLHHFVLTFSWKIRADECPMARPYVEFKRNLLIKLEQMDYTGCY